MTVPLHPSARPAIAPRYYHIARNMRGRAYSSDAIRRILIQRGLSWEKSFVVLHDLECEALAHNPPPVFAPRNRRQAQRRAALLALALPGVLLLTALGWQLSGFIGLLLLISGLALCLYLPGFLLYWL
ncbi:MAG: hypothetical protein MUE40_18150 [Anaerolineae bacterium]|nr:hypothetical protein [Anaerolineae bacterium]